MKTIVRQLLRTFIFILLTGSIFVVQGQVIKTFKPVYQQTQKGGIVFISNVATTCRIADTNALPPSTGTSNNNFPSYYVDRDGDPTTFSSTSDSLNLPPCSQISFVGLYWGGYATAATTNFATRKNIKIKANNNSYINVSSTWDTTYVGGSFTTYHCYKDITGIFQAYGNNTRWTVANVIGETVGNNRFAGWNIVIVYKNDLQNMRQLTVFNGLSNIQAGNIDIPVTGFLTPPTGPITFEMGVFCYDGDRGTTGDQLLFNGAGSYVNISDPLNVSNNVFNSTICRNGVLTPFRKPSYNNNFSIDADIFFPNNAAKNYIGNSATSCILRQTTSGDVYLTQTVTFAIDVYSPDNRTAVKVVDVNGGLTVPGDTLLYTVTCKNIGSDPSINTYVIDSMEGNIDYIPGSINIIVGPNSGSKTDVSGDDQAEYNAGSKSVTVRIGTGANAVIGGQVNDSPFGNDSTLFTFKAKVVSNCDVLYCDNIVDNSAFIIGTGVVSGIEYTNASNPNIFDAYGCPIPGTTKTVITAAQCPQYPDTSIVACSHQNFDVLFPKPGYIFYNSSWVSVLKPTAAGTYYGVHPIGIYCLDTVEIVISSYVFCNGPTANDDNGPALSEDGANGTVNVISNDTDADGNPTAPVNGVGEFTVDLDPSTPGVQSTFTDAQGVWTLNTATGEVTFDPANNYNGTAVITYTLCDPTALCDNATITFVVAPVNDPPDPDDDNGPALTEDGPNGTVNIINNDEDPDGDPTAPVNGVGQFTVDLDPGTAGIQTTFTDVQGVWTLNTATGVVTFDPANNYNGTAIIPYELCDPSGACDDANITFIVTPAIDPPVANDDNGAGLTEDGANGTVNVLTNDTDPDGNPTAPVNGVGQFTIDLDPGTAGIQTSFTDAQGVWNLNTATGDVTFDPANDYNGTAVIPYTLCDPSGLCDPANITFVVAPVNDPPVANDDNGPALTEDGPNGQVNVITNDTDVDGNPTAPVNGVGQFTVDLDPGTAGIQTTFTDAQGVWTLNTATGVVTFDPANNYNGTAVIPYTLCDPAGACDPANITFVVTPVNDPPIANNDFGAGTLTEDGSNGSVQLLANDTDPDGNPSGPVNGPGQFTIDLDPATPGLQTSFTDAQGVWTLNTTTGEVTFDPAPNYNGNAVIPYRLCDPTGLCSNATISFDVLPENDPPVVADDNATTNEDTPVTFNIAANDFDVDGPMDPTTIDLDPATPGQQTVLIVPGEGTYIATPATGDVTFIPYANFNGTTTPIPYSICDSGIPLPVNCDQANITVTVIAVNDPPTANDNAANTNINTPVTFNIITNDFDIDGAIDPATIDLDPLTPGNQTSFTIPGQGTYTVNTSIGDVTFTPALNFSGIVTPITYSVCDNGTPMPAMCDQAIISMEVILTNIAPVANDDGATTPEDTPVTFSITGNDTDADGVIDPATIDLDPSTPGNQTTFTIPGQGTYVANTTTGDVTFTPALNFNGPVNTITYSVCDNGMPVYCDQAIIDLNVTAVNDAPVVNLNSVSTSEETPVTFNVIGNDIDVEGFVDPASIDLDQSTPGNQTTLTIPGEGTYTANTTTGEVAFTPDLNFNGQATPIIYSACDNNLPPACDTAFISILVNGVNDPPVANPDIFTINEDNTLNATVITNDSDVDNNLIPTGFAIVSGTSNGTLNFSNNGTFTYTPNADYNGTDTFIYMVCDLGMPVYCDTALVTINVLPINDTPIAVDDIVTTPEDTPVSGNILTNDSDPEGDALTVVDFTINGTTYPYGTTVNISGVGTIVIDSLGNFTFTPDPNYNGPVPTVTYTITDGNGGTDQANLDIFVGMVNDNPIAVDDPVITPEDTPVSGNVLTNDSDPDGDVLTVVSFDVNGVTYPAGATVSYPGYGTITIYSNGLFTFIPALDFNGSVPVIPYVITDGNGGTATANLDILVTPVNDPPVIVEPPVVTAEDTPVTVCTTISDPDAGSVFTASLCGPPANGTITSGPTVVGNQVCFTYLPNTNFNGIDNVCVIVCDSTGLCDTSTSVITVVPVNDPLVANPDNFTTNEDTPLSGTVVPNDTDVDGNQNPNGFAIVTNPANGTLTFSNNGTFTYTPNANYNGTDSFIYSLCDLGMPVYCDTALVTINVLPVNDPPVIVEPPVVTPEDTPVTVCTTISDPDAGSVFTASLCGPPANGTITSGPTVVGNQVCFTYLPNTNFNGIDNVCVIVCDSTGLCDTSTSVITVVPVNDPLVANPDNYTTNEDTPITGTVITNDIDVDGNLNPNGYAIVSYPSNGTLIFSNNGTFTYTPNANYNGTDSFIYSLCDLGMPVYCDTALVTINVLPINDPPVIVEPPVVTPEDTPVTVCTTISDPDAGSVFTASLCGPPANGTITSGPTVVGNQVCFTYLPNTNFNGVDNVCVIVCDSTGLCDTSTSVITVVPVNDPLVANPDNFTTNEDTPITGTVITNDSDVDGNLNPTGFAIVSGPSNGTINFSNNGTFTYTPNPDYNGTDSFIYMICDFGMPIYCDTALVTINILPVNDPPIAVDDIVTTPEDTPVSGSVITNDSDPEGDALTVVDFTINGTTYPAGTTVTIPGVGVIVIDSTGNYTFTPDPNYNGPVPTVTYTITDGNGGFDQADLDIFVGMVNDPPVAVNDTVNTPEDTPVSGNALTNDSDIDGGPLSIVSFVVNGVTYPAGATVNMPGYGVITVYSNGLFNFTPAADFNGSVPAIPYTITDGSGGLATADIIITVTPVNDPPEIVEPAVVTPEDTPITVCTTITDPDANSVFTASLCGLPANGTITSGPTVNGNQVCFTYLPNTNFNGIDNVCVVVCDSTGLCDSSTSVITVVPVNDPLVADPDYFTTNEDTPITGTVITNDSDVDGNMNPTGFAIVSGPSNGTINFSNNGTFTYTPNPNYNGTDTFIYMVCDFGMPIYCDTALVTINVLPINDPPVFVEPTVTTPEDTPITVCTTITDPDANSIFTASLCGGPSNGTITSGPTVIGNQVCFTYLPNTNFNGIDNVCVTVCDSAGLCSSSTAVINVLPVNDPPIADPDNFATNEDTPITGTVITNDSDVDGNMNPTGFALVSGPANGTLTFSNNGTFTYTPDPNYYGPDSFIYMICDFGMPVYCDTAIVNIDVAPVNDVPVVFNEQISLCEGSSASVNVLLNGDFDPELTNIAVDTVLVSGPLHGTATITSGGLLTYTPNSGYFGPDYVVVAVCDGGIPLPSACSNDTVFITVDQSVFASAGYDTEFCDEDLDFFTLTGNDVPYANVHWTQISGPPAIISPANSNIAAAFINHTPGTYVFEYSVVNGTCSASSQVTYTLWLPPTVADAGPDQSLCGATFTTISGNVPLVGTGVWAQVSGPDTANIINPNQSTTVIMDLIPGTYVFSWTISNGQFCDPSVDYVNVTIVAPTTAFAGPNATICEGSNYTLSNATATNAVSVHWTTAGTGQFIDANVLNPVYIPSLNDILDGYVYLTITATATSPCPNVSSTMTLFISHQAEVYAGPDATICETAGSYTISGSTSENVVSYLWTSSGTGTFVGGNTLHPVYTPSPADIASGMVTLTVVATSASPCPSVTDAMILIINRQAVVNAGLDATICETGTYLLNGATAQFATGYLWTTSGTGTFSNPTILNPVYTPSLNDILDGHVNLTITATSASPCTTVSDVMTLTINHQAIVNAGPDAIICETQGSYTLSGSTSQYAVGYTWTTSGTGTFTGGNTLHPVYTPSPADIAFGSVTLTVVASSASPCPTATDAMVLTISRQAVISAGVDATICETGTYTLGSSTAQYATGLIWSTSGTGSFNNTSILHPVYTPSLNDIQDGFVYLTLTGSSASPCTMASDVMRLNISHQATNVFAGVDATICETDTYTLADATALNATSVLWTTSGTGTFNNSALLNPTYDPSPADVALGSVTLTLTANSASPCTSVSDAMTLSFSLQATSSAGPDDVVCEGSSYTLTGATATNATSYLWTTSGSGTFADNTILHAVYTPSAADILNGSITLSLLVGSESPCVNAPIDAMLLTISYNPVIYAGADTAICQNVSYYVDDATAQYATSIFWTENGTGTILNGGTLNPTYVPGPGETGVVMLTLNAISSVACGSDTTSDFMYLTIMESVIANAGPDTTIFANNSVALHGSATNGSGAYSFNWEPATILIYENTDHPITDPLTVTTTFIVTVTDLVTGCQDQDTVVITVDGINLPPVAVDDYDTTDYQTCITFPVLLNDYDPENTNLTISLCGPPVNGTVVINSDNTLTYCPYDGFSGDDSLCYQICDEGSPIQCAQATVYIHVKPEFTVDDLIIYNGVSPNGDGDNDVWIIYGIEFFPDNEATIFNRWGDVIANYTHYNNKDVSWDATHKGKLVPDGTYYYVLDIKNKKKFAGWIYVKTGK